VATKVKEHDKWIRNSLNSAIALLGPDVEALFTDGSFDRAAMPEADMLIAGKLELGLSKPTSNISAAYAHLLKSDKKLMKKYNVGKKIFLKDGSCVTCHQANGQGLPNIYPPLVGSEWATGDKERMIKLVLHGIWGKIDVNGKVFDPSKGVPPMTALGAMHDDAEIAAVMTYARASWGNAAPEITADEVKAVRAATKGRVGFYTPEELLNDHPMSKPDKSAVYFSPKAISSSDTVATYESRLENVIDSSGLKKPVSMLTDETVKTAAHRRGWVSSLQFSNAPQGKSGGQKRATFDLEIVNPLDGDATISHLILWNYTQSNLSNRALGNYRLYVDTGSGFGEKPAQSGVFLAAKEEHTPHLVPLSELKLSKGQSVKLRIRARSQGGDSVGIDEIAFRAIPAQ
jgi:mono/diheme cytochrome c family protein